jgi:outer membrane protein assembly factor BamB
MIGESAAPLTHKGAPDQVERWLTLLEHAAPALDHAALAHIVGAMPSGQALCDLAEALGDLGRGVRRRAAVRVRAGDEAFEVGLERSGNLTLASVYGSGANVTLHRFEAPVDAAGLSRTLAAELERRSGSAPAREADRLAAVGRALGAARFDDEASPLLESVVIEPSDELPFAFGAELALRAHPQTTSNGGGVLRTEVLPLLFKGRLRVVASDHTRDLADVHVFLLAEKLVDLALEALDASARLRPLWRKVEAGGVLAGVRLVGGRGRGTRDVMAFSLAPVRRSGPRIEGWTFPSLELGSFAGAVADFGRSLARTLLRWDRTQTHNLRIVELKSRLREISEMCREMDHDDTLVNTSPESYRAYATANQAAPQPPRADLSAARLRFAPKWTAAVPAIDLRSIFLCGDAFVVGSSREVSCIHRSQGTIAWTRPAARGVSVMTPSGLARIDESGTLSVIDVASGELRSTLRLEPRVGGPITGAVISAPGLPRMLVVSEGRRRLCGVDLEAGEIVWRLATRRGGTFRFKRAGRLVVVSAGEQGLFAVDVVTGEVVWRFRARLRFSATPSICDDSLFAIAGDAALSGGGSTRLFHLDPWSGTLRWSVDLPGHARPVGAPHVGRRTVLVVTMGARGSQLVAFDRATGELLYAREACRGGAAALLVDDLAILNSELGELSAFGANDGELRYRHVFSEPLEGDRPRRLEPVLRSGALFIPQSQVHVVRPADGRIVGVIDTDLVADLLRVDERCDVYVAEESGHVAAFSAVARLSVVK